MGLASDLRRFRKESNLSQQELGAMDLVRSETGVDERNGVTETATGLPDGAASPQTTLPQVLRDADPAANGGRKGVVFIDTGVADWGTLAQVAAGCRPAPSRRAGRPRAPHWPTARGRSLHWSVVLDCPLGF